MSDLDRIYQLQRQNCAAVGATTAAQRAGKIRNLERRLLERRDEVRAAMWEDFRKPPEEVDLIELFAIAGEARHASRHLRRWMRPHRVAPTVALLGTRSSIVYEPKGAVLILSPWNFPFNLSLGPLISAVAAGNCVILKPSEVTSASSALMKRLLGELFPEDEVAVIEGGGEIARRLLEKKFDHIFFTGSPSIGKVVMKAAAEHLTPVTLELGGKSPAIVDRSADVDAAAKRLAWGKYLNAGQVCIAPDYLLVHDAVYDEFVRKLKENLESFGPDTALVVNDRHATRVRALLDDAVGNGAQLLRGGAPDGRNGATTVIGNVALDAKVMEEEIFGPVLPILRFATIDDAVRTIGEREKPLVLFVFARSRDVVREVLARTSSGAAVINHVGIHFYQLNLPFGGVGNSGMGRGHGFFGFQAFSNARAVLDQSFPWSGIDLLIPPYTRLKRKFIDFTLKYL